MGDKVPALTWDNGKYNFQRKLGNFVQYFQVNLPTNSYGVPLKMVDPMPIAENMLDCETTDDLPEHILELAVMDVDFEEGMPVIEGLPIWERFDGEQLEYYKYFKEYRDMLYLGGSRAISKLAHKFNIEGRFLGALSKIYHWQMRCRAYDAYKKATNERMRQFEIEQLQNKHTKASNTLLEYGLKYIEDHPEQLNPKVALQMVQIAMKSGRLALGLNGDKPGSGDGVPNISISNTTTNTSSESPSTESEGKKQAADPSPSYLQSIVHILDQSGALDKAKSEVIDADYVEMDDDSEAVGGA
jgi:hypothetical protein